MKSSTRKPPTLTKAPPRRKGGGYKLGPRPAKPIPPDAIWLTSNQVCARYGARSHMWLWRKFRNDPAFSKPRYQGRMQIFLVAEFDEYDRSLISKNVGSERRYKPKPLPTLRHRPGGQHIMIRPASMRAIARRKTAYHEAGHAVLGRVLTLVCDSATIKPDHDSAGHSSTHDPWASIYEWEKRGKVREPDAVWHARIIGFMAGAEAEAELLGAVPRGDGDDRYQIELMAEELETPAKRWDTKIEPRLRAMTRMLVHRHRVLIERVAQALIDQTTLSREELDNLVGRSVDRGGMN